MEGGKNPRAEWCLRWTEKTGIAEPVVKYLKKQPNSNNEKKTPI